MPTDFEQLKQSGLACGGLRVVRAARLRVARIAICHLFFLALPVGVEAAQLVPGQHLLQEVNFSYVGQRVGAVAVFDLLGQPVAYGLFGGVAFVAAVAPELNAVAEEQASEKADEVKGDGVGGYGFGDLLKGHGLGFLLYFLAGAMFTMDFRRKK